MSLLKFIFYCLIVCLSLITLPVSQAQTTTEQWIQKRQQQIIEAQTELEQVRATLQTQQRALRDVETTEITQQMLKQAALQLETGNLKQENLRFEIQKVQKHLDTVNQNQQLVELDQQYLDILNTQTELLHKQIVSAIELQMQLQTVSQLRQLKEREPGIVEAEEALKRSEESLRQVEFEILPNYIAMLDVITFDKLTEFLEEASLEIDLQEVQVNNLTLEYQNAHLLLEKQRQSINQQQTVLEEQRKIPITIPKQQIIQQKRIAEQEAVIEVQKKKLYLDQRELNLIGQRLELAKKSLETWITWYEKIHAIYPERQKQAIEQKNQQQRQSYMSRAAELRWQLNRIPEENSAQREWLSTQIQQANEQAQQVERLSQLEQKQEQIKLWATTAQTLQEIPDISHTELKTLAIWVDKMLLLLQELQASQDLLQTKMSILAKQQQLVKKRGSTLTGTSLEYHQQTLQILATIETMLQQELEQTGQIQEKGQDVLALLETVYKEKLHIALSKPRQLPTTSAEWQSLLEEFVTLPVFLLRQLQFTVQGLIQAFQHTTLQHWKMIGLVILIWLALVISTHIWFIHILDIIKKIKKQRFVTHLLLVLHLWRLNLPSITIISTFLLLLWFIQPEPLSFTVTVILLSTWLVGKLLINFSWLSLAAPDAKIKNQKLYRQIRRVILIIGSFLIVTALIHIENHYMVKLSLTIQELIDSLFLILLSLTVLPLWQIRWLISSQSEDFEGDWQLISFLITFIAPTIVIISILGLVGYINLAWIIAKHFSFFLVALIVWMIARTITTDFISWWKSLFNKTDRFYELWQEDIIPLVQKLSGIVLLLLAVIFYLWISGGLVDTAVKDDIAQILSYSIVTFDNTHKITISGVLLSVFIIWFVFWLGSWSRGVSHRWIYLGIKDTGLRNSLAVFTQYVVIIVGLLIALKAIGIDPTALTVLAGALGVGIGFGLQNIVNNFVSGILLLMGGKIRVGDLVTISSFDNLTVKEINWINTEFDQFGIHVVIPNSDILSSKVKNFTIPNHNNLIWFWPSVYIDPQIPPEKVEKILTEALTGIEDLVDIWILMAGLKPTGVMEYWPCFTCTYPKRWAVQERVWHSILSHLKKAGIEPAVPSQEIHLFDATQGRTMRSSTTPPVPPMITG